MDKAEKVFSKIASGANTSVLEKQAGPMWETVKKFTKNILSKGKIELGKSKNYIQSSIRGESPAIAKTPVLNDLGKRYNQNQKFIEGHYRDLAPVSKPGVSVMNSEQKAQALFRERYKRNMGM